jgi:LPXTG-motif cell wall-anchored protein
MKALPHTASSLPLISLAGMLALFGAAFLGLRRLAASR